MLFVLQNIFLLLDKKLQLKNNHKNNRIIANKLHRMLHSSHLDIISIIIIGFSIYHLQTKAQTSVKCQWWNNSLEISLLYLVLASVIVGLYYEFKTLKIVSMYMIFSILVGLMQSIVVQSFKPIGAGMSN